jgi:hypothetical protein
MGLNHGRVDLPVLVDNFDCQSSSVGKVHDLLVAHVPPHLDTFGLELGGVDDGPTQLHVKLSGEFFTSFIVDRCTHFC